MESAALDPTQRDLARAAWRAPRLALMALAWCASTGCAANAALQAEVQALRTEVTSLRATAGAMTERLDALEMEGGGLKVAGAAPAPEAAPPSDAPPNLQVVTLKPTTDAITETEAPAQPLETGPRVKNPLHAERLGAGGGQRRREGRAFQACGQEGPAEAPRHEEARAARAEEPARSGETLRTVR